MSNYEFGCWIENLQDQAVSQLCNKRLQVIRITDFRLNVNNYDRYSSENLHAEHYDCHQCTYQILEQNIAH